MSRRSAARTHLARPFRQACLSVVACCLAGGGGTARSAESIDLEQVVRDTLTASTSLRLAALDVEIARAAWLQAAEPFDSALVFSAGKRRSYEFSTPPGMIFPPLLVEQLELAAGASKRFRSGLTLSPTVTSTQVRIHATPRADYTRTSAALRLQAPLLRDFGGIVTRAPEQAAGAEHVAAGYDEQQSAARALRDAAEAYWGYLAASRRLEVQIASEERARRTAEEMSVLVKADERTRSDLAQAQGTFASRRATRIAAEQSVVEAWATITVLTGAPPGALIPLPRPSTEFPVKPPALDDQALRVLIEQATRARPDVAAAQARVGGSQVLVRAGRNDLWPRLDLNVVGGFTAQELGPGLGRIGDSFHRDVPGVEGLVLLSLELPLVRSGARGRLAQASAALERDQIAEQDLRRTIGIGVVTAIEIIRRSRLALEESERAVTLLQQTEEAEKRKFKLGASTLLAVIQAEDSLTGARLTMIEGQRALAVAIANLRFETGALMPVNRVASRNRRVSEVVPALLRFP
jgi:outer membrane protein